ncbi:MAG: LPS export ABC transporter periplasmic protein LptC [Nitrospirae bacterium]|nr:LPS export ABC transporter periplasmic protein LptC [Nitrospirota bacterium]
MKKVKIGFLGIILLILVFLMFAVLAGIRQKSFNFVVKEGLKKADIHIGNFSFFQTKEGGKEWELRARKAELFESQNKAVLEGIHVTIHTESGMEISFQGDEGTIDTKRKNFHIQNKSIPIQINMSNGYQAEMMQVDWDNEKKQILSESPIIIRGGNWDVHGNGFIFKTNSEEFLIKRNIEAHVTS